MSINPAPGNLSPVNSSYQSPPPTQLPVKWKLPAKKSSVTITLLVLTVLVFGLQFLSVTIFGADLPFVLGGKVNSLIIAGQVWRLITPMLLHADILHLLFNMYALFVIGMGLERQYGHSHYLLLYLTAGYCGNVASFLLTPAASLGASTAIFGLIGAQAMFLLHNRKLLGQKANRMLMNVGFVIVINLLIGFSGSIDMWGHLGGLAGGLAFAYFSGPRWYMDLYVTGYEIINHRSRKAEWLSALAIFAAASLLAGLKILGVI